MMNIDFIKWMCEKAEGFRTEDHECDDELLFLWYGKKWLNMKFYDTWSDELSEYFKETIYPLLLQRAIEGVNREYFNEGSMIKPLGIKQYPAGISLFHAVDRWEKQFDVPFEADTYCQAKESALMYIYEQEREK